MSHDAISSWVEKAKQSEDSASGSDTQATANVQVIKRVAYNKGSLIMELAEKMRPRLMKLLANVRDENDMLVQPARVRAIALNIAQKMINHQDNAANA